jgi:hypothetical protein
VTAVTAPVAAVVPVGAVDVAVEPASPPRLSAIVVVAAPLLEEFAELEQPDPTMMDATTRATDAAARPRPIRFAFRRPDRVRPQAVGMFDFVNAWVP